MFIFLLLLQTLLIYFQAEISAPFVTCIMTMQYAPIKITKRNKWYIVRKMLASIKLDCAKGLNQTPIQYIHAKNDSFYCFKNEITQFLWGDFGHRATTFWPWGDRFHRPQGVGAYGKRKTLNERYRG